MKWSTLLASAACAASFASEAPGAWAQVPSVINVEIDWMETGAHSHRPTQLAIDAAVQMFACHGITLNVVVDEAIPEVTVMQCPIPGGQGFFTCTGIWSFLELKRRFAGLGTAPGWHYCIFGHQYENGSGTDSSGLGETGGNDFIVTLSGFSGMPNGSDFDQAATFVHELGHNLGLGHESPASLFDNGEFAVNYASIMSYQYQLLGVKSRLSALGAISTAHLFKDLDYSNGRLPILVESSLSEPTGVGIHSIDWSCDGMITAPLVDRDLDDEANYCAQGAGTSILDDWNDWANIVDNTDSVEVYTDRVSHPYEPCITRAEHEALLAQLPPDPSGLDGPALTVEACKPGKMIFVDDSNPNGILGTGEDPYGLILSAMGVAPDHSVLFLQDGTYTNSGSGLLFNRPMTLAGPETAVIDP